jgi:Zn-finger nucleic acid-binding protein
MTYRAEQLSCPRCRSPLTGKTAMSCCERCGGMWMDVHELRALYEKEGAKRMADLDAFPDGSPTLPCAVCRQTMAPTFLDLIRLEECEAHGIWLEDGVLTKLMAHAKRSANGGIEEQGYRRVSDDPNNTGGGFVPV